MSVSEIGRLSSRPMRDEVVALFQQIRIPQRRVGKRLHERGDLALHRRFVGFVERHPLREDAAGLQMAPRDLQILLRVQRRRAAHPRVDGIRRDDVERLVRRLEEVSRVVEHELDARIVEDVMVLDTEVLPGACGHDRLDLADDNAFDFGMDDEGSGRDAGADTDDEDGLRVRVHQRRDVAEHALEAHVDVHVGRFDLAADVELTRAGGVLGHGDRRRRALAQIQESS